MKKTLQEKDSELESKKDAFKQLLLTNKSLQSMIKLNEEKYLRSTGGQIIKSETKEELVDPNSQHTSATEESKATYVSYIPDNRDYKGPDPGPASL